MHIKYTNLSPLVMLLTKCDVFLLSLEHKIHKTKYINGCFYQLKFVYFVRKLKLSGVFSVFFSSAGQKIKRQGYLVMFIRKTFTWCICFAAILTLKWLCLEHFKQIKGGKWAIALKTWNAITTEPAQVFRACMVFE